MSADRISWRVGDAGHTVFGPKLDGAVSPETIATVRKASNARFIVAAQAFVYRMAEQGNADAMALVLGDEYNSAPHKRA